jgi:hypothetical protein
MVHVRPATPDLFDDVYPLLLDFANPKMSRDDWRRMLFDLPWPVEEPHRGYALYDGEQVVGFLGTIFSTRVICGVTRRFCNLSSWIVKDAYRSSSLQLVLPVLALKQHTIVNLSPSPGAYEIFARLGFRKLEDHQLLVPPFARPGELLRAPTLRVVTRPEVVRRMLEPAAHPLMDHMSGTLAAQAVVTSGGRSCHVIATRSPWKGTRCLAHVQYASDWAFVLEHSTACWWAFFRTLGAMGLRIDGRHGGGRGPRLAIRRRLALPAQYRPSDPEVTPDRIDGLYTEAVGLRW